MNNNETCKCEYSKDGLCLHYLSQGELKCKGKNTEKNKCMIYNELE